MPAALCWWAYTNNNNKCSFESKAGAPSNVRVITSGHVTKMAATPLDPPYNQNKPLLHANMMALSFIELEDRSLHCEYSDFGSCDLDLDPMIFIHELDPYCLELYRICRYELQAFESYCLTDTHTIHTDRQRDRIDRDYKARNYYYCYYLLPSVAYDPEGFQKLDRLQKATKLAVMT